MTISRNAGALLLAAGTAFAAPAAIAQEGFYLGASIGLNSTQDQDISTGPFSSAETSFSNGYDASLYGGYGFGQVSNVGSVRAELQLSFRDSDVDTISRAGVPALSSSGSFRETAGFVNGYFDFDQTGTAFTPYIGAGIGYGRLEASRYSTLEGGLLLDDSTDSFGYQLIAGVGYGLSDQATLFADYRFRDYPDASVTTAQFNSTDLDARSHSLNVGVRLGF